MKGIHSCKPATLNCQTGRVMWGLPSAVQVSKRTNTQVDGCLQYSLRSSKTPSTLHGDLKLHWLLPVSVPFAYICPFCFCLYLSVPFACICPFCMCLSFRPLPVCPFCLRILTGSRSLVYRIQLCEGRGGGRGWGGREKHGALPQWTEPCCLPRKSSICCFTSLVADSAFRSCSEEIKHSRVGSMKIRKSNTSVKPTNLI